MPKQLSHEADPEHVPDVIYNSQLELKPKRVLYGLAIGTVILTIGIAGAFYLTDYFNPKPTPIPPIEIKKATPSSQTSETADWKTLTSKTHESNPEIYDPTKTVKFSFKYPTDFSTVQDEDVILVTNDSDYQLGLKTAGKIAAWARISTPNLEVESTTNSSLGNEKALHKVGEGFVLYHIPTLKTEEGLEVSFVFQCVYIPKDGVKAVKTCDLMASTFKFLD